MNFQKKVTRNNYIREYVTVLNGLLDLTPREIDVLTSMIKIDVAWTPRSVSEVKDIMSTDSRRLLLKDTNMNKSNFNKIANKLISVGLIVKSKDDKYIINELLKPTIIKVKDKNIIEIKFTLEVADAVQ